MDDRVSTYWWIGYEFVMVAGADGAVEEAVMGVSVYDWHTSTKRTTIHCFRALLSSRLGVRVTTRRAASHCALGSRFARCHSTFGGASGWLSSHPRA